MNIGDLVKKVSGEMDRGDTGIIIKIQTNPVGEIIMEVISRGEVKNWYSEFIEKVEK